MDDPLLKMLAIVNTVGCFNRVVYINFCMSRQITNLMADAGLGEWKLNFHLLIGDYLQ